MLSRFRLSTRKARGHLHHKVQNEVASIGRADAIERYVRRNGRAPLRK